MTAIFILLIFGLAITVLVLSIKNSHLKKDISGLCDTRRHGVIYVDLVDNKKNEVKVSLYVQELERYTNGTSKIKCVDAEAPTLDNPGSWCMTARALTPSLVNTNEVEWLESEKALSEERKEKLEKIRKKWKI